MAQLEIYIQFYRMNTNRVIVTEVLLTIVAILASDWSWVSLSSRKYKFCSGHVANICGPPTHFRDPTCISADLTFPSSLIFIFVIFAVFHVRFFFMSSLTSTTSPTSGDRWIIRFVRWKFMAAGRLRKDCKYAVVHISQNCRSVSTVCRWNSARRSASVLDTGTLYSDSIDSWGVGFKKWFGAEVVNIIGHFALIKWDIFLALKMKHVLLPFS